MAIPEFCERNCVGERCGIQFPEDAKGFYLGEKAVKYNSRACIHRACEKGLEKVKTTHTQGKPEMHKVNGAEMELFPYGTVEKPTAPAERIVFDGDTDGAQKKRYEAFRKRFLRHRWNIGDVVRYVDKAGALYSTARSGDIFPTGQTLSD